MSGVSNKLICVVDDDPSMLRMLDRAVAAAGFDVVCFGSAEEFLAAGLDNQSACLILDVDLPGMTGLQLQQHLNDAGGELPVIIISGAATEETRLSALKGGAVAFFNKPFSIDPFLNCLRSVALALI